MGARPNTNFSRPIRETGPLITLCISFYLRNLYMIPYDRIGFNEMIEQDSIEFGIKISLKVPSHESAGKN